MTSSVAFKHANNGLQTEQDLSALLADMKQRSILLVDAIDTAPGLTRHDQEGFATVLGSLTLMIQCIESAIRIDGNGDDLLRRGLLAPARKLVIEIDQVLEIL